MVIDVEGNSDGKGGTAIDDDGDIDADDDNAEIVKDNIELLGIKSGDPHEGAAEMVDVTADNVAAERAVGSDGGAKAVVEKWMASMLLLRMARWTVIA